MGTAQSTDGSGKDQYGCFNSEEDPACQTDGLADGLEGLFSTSSKRVKAHREQDEYWDVKNIDPGLRAAWESSSYRLPSKAGGGVGITLIREKSGLLIVSSIDPGSPAENSREIAVGDTLLRVNNIDVHQMDIDDVSKLLQGDENSKVALLIVKNDLWRSEVTAPLKTPRSHLFYYTPFLYRASRPRRIDAGARARSDRAGCECACA